MRKIASILFLLVTISLFNDYSYSQDGGERDCPECPSKITPDTGGGDEVGCYTTTILECPGAWFWSGGQRIVCQFSGEYGAPYFCTETYCGNSNADKRRKCTLPK